MTSQYVVIAQSPGVDVSQVAGPYRSYGEALDADSGLVSKGYNTEICPLVKASEIDDSPGWDDESC